MRLLERYIFSEMIRVFASVLSVTTLLMVFVGVLGQVRENGLGIWQIIQILPFIVPSLMPYTIPAAMLLTVCMVYGRLSGDREIIAAKAAGIPVLQLMWPSFFLGGVLSVAALLLSDQVIPWSMTNIERIVTLAMEDIFLDVLRTQNQFTLREPALTMTVLDVRGRSLIEPTIRYSSGGKSAVTIRAAEAELQFDLQKREVKLRLRDWWMDVPGKLTSVTTGWEDRVFKMPNQNARLKVRNLRISDIDHEVRQIHQQVKADRQTEQIEAALILATGQFDQFLNGSFAAHTEQRKEASLQVHRMETEKYSRFATSTSCLFFVLVGSPFSILMARKQFITSFLFCFVPILLVYYPVLMMTQNLSKTGQFDPQYAMWLANGLMAVAAVYFLRRVAMN